jgi:hypothetical protein
VRRAGGLKVARDDTMLLRANRSCYPPAMPWSRNLTTPITLKDGRTIATLSEAREMMLSLSPSQRRLAVWRFTSLMLADAAIDDARLEEAELLLRRALKVERLL